MGTSLEDLPCPADNFLFQDLLAVYPDPLGETHQVGASIEPYFHSCLEEDGLQMSCRGTLAIRSSHMNYHEALMGIPYGLQHPPYVLQA
jgi:hypothetical protein